tara:strand:- start:136 stop:816 length:681 start_codon:yes stop_codon:yes gene_type:complete
MQIPRPKTTERPPNPYLPGNENILGGPVSQKKVNRVLGRKFRESIEGVTNSAVYEGALIGPWIYGSWEFLNLITPIAYQLTRDHGVGESIQTSLPIIGWGAVAGPAVISLLPERWIPVTRGGGTFADSTPVQAAAIVGGALAGEKYFKAIAGLGGNLAESIGEPLAAVSYVFNKAVQVIPELMYGMFQEMNWDPGTQVLGYDFIRHFAIPSLMVGAGIHALKRWKE